VENRDACNAIFGAWLADRTRAVAIEALTRLGVPIAPVNTYGDAARDPHVLERDMLQPTRLEDGSVAPIVGPAVKFSRTPTRVRAGAPALGAHNEEILAELGIDTATQMRLAVIKVTRADRTSAYRKHGGGSFGPAAELRRRCTRTRSASVA
jgi:formyl-CoA transferase